MIKQQILFDNEEILRIYHDDFKDYPKDRKLYYKKEVKGHIIEFKELYITNITEEEIHYDEEIDGFLYKNHNKNPYTTYCCYYREFINYRKKDFIERIMKDKKIFNTISDFIKQWTGFNLRTSPFSIYNILIFTPSFIDIKMKLDRKNQKSIYIYILENPYTKLTISVKFKINNIIVDSKIYNEDVKVIGTDKDWNKIDVEIYNENYELVYKAYDLSFIKQMNINMNLLVREVEKNLKKTSKSIKLKEVIGQPIKIGNKNNTDIFDYLYQEKLACKELKANKSFDFLRKNEYDKALKIFKKIANNSDYDEMWIFDPYFIDYNVSGGKDRLEDIITALSVNLSLKKFVVFYYGEDCNILFKDFLDSFSSLRLLVGDKGLNYEFYGIKEKFHDRFVFLKNNLGIKGYMIGTSFNSFGDNYSTILELENYQAEFIFNILKSDLLTDENILLKEGI